MSFCPSCTYEYVQGITRCPDCRVDLVDELPADTISAVSEVSQRPGMVEVASFLLEEPAQEAKLKLGIYGIKSELANETINQTSGPWGHAAPLLLLVESKDAERAIELLQDEIPELSEEMEFGEESKKTD